MQQHDCTTDQHVPTIVKPPKFALASSPHDYMNSGWSTEKIVGEPFKKRGYRWACFIIILFIKVATFYLITPLKLSYLLT